MSFLLFDIGGTKIRFAISKDGSEIGEKIIIDNPKDYNEALQEIEGIVKKLSLGGKIEGAAGGISGIWNKERSGLVSAPHLPLWKGKAVKADFERIIGTPVFIENDSAIVGLGEAVAGAGKGSSVVMYMTVSTGVGGARIVDGRIDKAVLGFEPGHQIVDFSSAVSPRFNVLGTLEGFVSGTSLSKEHGVSPRDIPSNNVVWDELAEILAVGIYNSILHWSPDIVVLGGSMITGNPAISIEAVTGYLKDRNQAFDPLPQLKKALLADDAGFHGALAYLKQQAG